ncbi:MAG: pentapeptide repeat-containing protein [Cyanobacteria bacterium P01_A01_bin.84]
MTRYWRVVIAVAVALAIFFHPLSAEAVKKSVAGKKRALTKDFSNQTLIAREFTKLNLEDTDFSNSDLRGSVFNGSALINSDMHGMDFSNGIAYLVDFQGADLRDANLTDAMMLYSTFDGVNIDGADFTNSVIDGVQQKKLCAIATGVNSKTGVSTRESLECK